MKIRIIGLIVALAVVASLLPGAVLAAAPPPMPQLFYGTVTLLDSAGEPIGPAGEGLIVTAWVGGVQKASCTTVADATFGGVPVRGAYGLDGGLKVTAEPGDLVAFKVGSTVVEQDPVAWVSGDVTRLDLSFVSGEAPAPDVPTLLAPPDGDYTNDNTPTFEWSPVEDPAGSGISYSLQVATDFTFSAKVIDREGIVDAFFTAPVLADGSYYWRVEAVNGYSKKSGWSSAWVLHVDTVPPTVENTVVPPPETNDNAPSFEGNADGTGSALVSVEFKVDDGSWMAATFTSGALTSAYSFTTPVLLDGPHTVAVRATDAAGNVTLEAQYAAYNFEVDTGAPTVTIDPLVPDPTTERRPSFNGQAADAPSTWITRVQFRVDGAGEWYEADPAPGQAFDTTPVDYVFTVPYDLPDGPHFVEVRAYDAAGNVTAPENYARDDFTVDATPPVITDVAAVGATTYSVVVRWETNEPATSQVEYGTVSAAHGGYEFITPLDPELVLARGIYIDGLAEGTTYYYRVISADHLGNEAYSDEFSFTTQTDTTPPVITDVGVRPGSITTSGAIILWNTDEPATSQIEYGTSSAAHGGYPNTTPLSELLVMGHGISIDGLMPNTTYYYRVMSADRYDNLGWSEEYVFSTLPDTTPPDITGITVTNITATSAIINWNTNEPASSQVQYSTDMSFSRSTPLNPALVYFHSVVVSGLTPDTTYNFRVVSTDEAGNTAISDPPGVFDTLPDTTPPSLVSGPDSSTGETTASVVWITDESSTSQVAYSRVSHAGASYGSVAEVLAAYGSSTPENPGLVTNHDVSFGGLTPSTTYYYRVISKDAYGNAMWSDEFSFTTQPDTTPPVITDVGSTAITQRGAVIQWNTDEPATTQVEYGTLSALHGGYQFVTPLDAFLVLGHGVSLSGLSAETMYYYRVISTDASGNDAWSEEHSFETAADTTPPVISGVTESNITSKSAIVYWNTDEPATSQVEFGTASAAHGGYERTSSFNPALVYVHGVVLDGLLPSTTYYYRVISRDGSAAANEGWSDEYSFTTLPDTTPPVISAVVATDVRAKKASIYWNTNEASTTQVEYGTASAAHGGYAFATSMNASLVSIHGVVLDGLTPNTTYYYRVISKDAYDNEAVSDEHTFATLPDTTKPVILSITVSNITDTTAIVYWMTDERSTTQVEYGTSASYGKKSPYNPALVYYHGVVLSGLQPNTTYHFRVISKDAYDNEAVSGDDQFDTLPDSTPPDIFGVEARHITGTSALIYWATNEKSTTQVVYDTVEHADPGDYAWSSLLNTNKVYSHSVMLVGLTQGTEYHYRVLSKDANDNEAVSDDYTFETLTDTTPPEISGVGTTNVTGTSAVVLWLTDEPATSQVEYGTTSATHGSYDATTPEDATMVTHHGAVLIGLTAGQDYYYRVISRDGAGNETVSDEYSFITEDTTPPAILWMDAVAPSATAVVAVWLTDESSTSQVVYSTTSHVAESYGHDAAAAALARADYGSFTTEDGTLNASHGQVVMGLTSGTYYYRVISADAAGNYVISEERSFTIS